MAETGAPVDPKLLDLLVCPLTKGTLRYDSGRELDWFLTGFSPRKKELTLYIMPGFDRYDDLMAKLGKHKTGKSCLYIKRLADVDATVLRALVESSVKHMRGRG